MQLKIRRLESVIERLELIPIVPSAVNRSAGVHPSNTDLTKAFVVHGHDGEARESTAHFLQKLGVEPIILHEQANQGRTLVEKLEHYGKVGFAVVILTPDDMGKSAAE